MDSAHALPPLTLPSRFFGRSSSISPVAIFITVTAHPTTSAGRLSPFGPRGPTDVYMVETVNADGDAPFTAEGGVYVEDPGFDYNEASNPIKDLGVFYPASRDILEDEPMMENILQVRVAERMSRRLDNAFLNQVTATNATSDSAPHDKTGPDSPRPIGAQSLPTALGQSLSPDCLVP